MTEIVTVTSRPPAADMQPINREADVGRNCALLFKLRSRRAQDSDRRDHQQPKGKHT